MDRRDRYQGWKVHFEENLQSDEDIQQFNEETFNFDAEVKEGTLALDSKDILSFPMKLFECKSIEFLTNLDLSYNQLTSIPDKLCTDVRNLHVLAVDGNNFSRQLRFSDLIDNSAVVHK